MRDCPSASNCDRVLGAKMESFHNVLYEKKKTKPQREAGERSNHSLGVKGIK